MGDILKFERKKNAIKDTSDESITVTKNANESSKSVEAFTPFIWLRTGPQAYYCKMVSEDSPPPVPPDFTPNAA